MIDGTHEATIGEPVDALHEIGVGSVVIFVMAGRRFAGHAIAADARAVALVQVELLNDDGTTENWVNPVQFIDRRHVLSVEAGVTA